MVNIHGLLADLAVTLISVSRDGISNRPVTYVVLKTKKGVGPLGPTPYFECDLD